MPTLFDPLKLGALELPNRILMAPLTRSRATPDTRVPTPLQAEYYRQRAGAGLIISEATSVSPMGVGYTATPGQGRGFGLASMECYETHIAVVCEVSGTAEGVKLERINVCADCGVAVHPDQVVPRGRRLLVLPEVERRVAGERDDFLDPDMPHRVEPLRRELVAQPAERIAGLVLGVRHIGGQQRPEDLAAFLPGLELAGDVDHFGRKEQLENIGILAVPKRPEQRGGREFFLLVDMDVDHVVDIDRELNPRAPERNDPS